jgi:hypothetical protein
MLRAIVVFLGKLYRFVVSLVLVALLAVAAWFMWHLYEDEKLQNRFLKEGQVVEVEVTEVDWSRHSFRDTWGNSNYLTFPYHQKKLHHSLRIRFDLGKFGRPHPAAVSPTTGRISSAAFRTKTGSDGFPINQLEFGQRVQPGA